MKAWFDRANERERLLALFGAAFVIRAAAYLILRGYLGFGFFHPDSAYYDLRAQSLVQHGAAADWRSAAFYEGFTFVAAVTYAVFGPAFQIVEGLNLIIGALLPVVAFKMGRALWTDSVGWGGALIASLDPMLVYWSAHFLKEPWVVLLGFLAVHATLAARWNPSSRALVGCLVLLLLSSFRAHSAVGLSAALAIVLAFRKEWIGGLGCGLVTVLVLVRIQGGVPEGVSPPGAVGTPPAPGARRTISEDAPKLLTPINRWRISSDVRSHVSFFPDGLPKEPFNTWGDFLLFLLVSPVYLLLAPFPWQASNRFEAMYTAAMLWWYLVLGLGAIGAWKTWRSRQTKELVWLIAALGIPLTLMLTTTGPFIRWRTLACSLLIPIAGYALSLLVARWRRIPGDPVDSAGAQLRGS